MLRSAHRATQLGAVVVAALASPGCAFVTGPVLPGAIDTAAPGRGHVDVHIEGGAGVLKLPDDYEGESFEYAGGAARVGIGVSARTTFQAEGSVAVQTDLEVGTEPTPGWGARLGVRHHVVDGLFTLGGGVAAAGFGADTAWLQPDIEIGLGHAWKVVLASVALRAGPQIPLVEPASEDVDLVMPAFGVTVQPSLGMALFGRQRLVGSVFWSVGVPVEHPDYPNHFFGFTLGWHGRF